MENKKKAEAINVSSYYAYHVQNPFDVQNPMIDKNGVLHFISMAQYLDDIRLPKNDWKLTKIEETFRMVALACIPLGFLLIALLIGQRNF